MTIFHTTKRMLPCMMAVLLGLASAPAGATIWGYAQTIHAPNLPAGTGNVHFGTAVAVDRNVDGSLRALYVGAPGASVRYNNVDYPGAGKVYVLSPIGGWHVNTTLSAASGFIAVQNDAHFGAAVAVHNGLIVIGAPDEDFDAGHPDVGAVRIFRDIASASPGVEPSIQSYTYYKGGASSANFHFGDSVDVDGYGMDAQNGGSIVVAGAPNANGTGCAYAYRLSSGGGDTEGVVCGANSGDALGASVAVHVFNSTLFVMVAGAPGVTQGAAALAGEVTVYIPQNGNLTKIDTLTANAPAFLDAFGTAVGVDANRVYVGATGRVKNGVGHTGSVSVFKPASIIGYDFDVELFPGSGAAAGDLCGASVYVDPTSVDRFAIGCPGSDGLVADEGFVRVFKLGSLLGNPYWFQDLLDMADLPHGADDLSRGFVFFGDHVYAGAPLADDAVGTNNGAVRIFATDHIFADGYDG